MTASHPAGERSAVPASTALAVEAVALAVVAVAATAVPGVMAAAGVWA